MGLRSQFQAIGIDAEVVGRVSPDIWPLILIPNELAWLESSPPTEQTDFATLLFSAKESFYKCQYEITGQWLEFKDVEIRVTDDDSGRGRFSVRPVNEVDLFERGHESPVGRFAVVDRFVLTAMYIAPD